MTSTDYSDVTSYYDDYHHGYNDTAITINVYFFPYIMYVTTCVIISIGLPLTLLAIYSLYSQFKNDRVAPIFIINLLISDIIQFCYMIFQVANNVEWRIYEIFNRIYLFGLMASVFFMVCIALERYLLIVWPLWYRFRRTIKISLSVCVVVWTLALICFFVLPFWVNLDVKMPIFAVFLLIPFPLFIFFLVGTLKALSAAVSVPTDEKRRIVGILVLVLLIYMLMFLPAIMLILGVESTNYKFNMLTEIVLKFSPLADLILYVFMRKGVIDKLLASLCCCRMDSDDNSRSSA